ncbi:hypothetical protein [Methylosarcina fibrata]|uniref:hypothetical protein n=1 Tax=Methylosarcina fibrata TaxID=105972 RepID=UPI0012FC815D|nr:hypothetical protein [Methylosarcina fibrata]
MKRTFAQSVLSTQKRRQSYFYCRNLIAGGCGLFAYVKLSASLGMTIGAIVGFTAMIASYLTIAPLIALLLCLFEQMLS